MKTELPFMTAFALADCAALAFAQYHPAKNPPAPLIGNPEVDAQTVDSNATIHRLNRSFRMHPVLALRHLWQSGNADQRQTVAARVAIWVGRPVKETMERVGARERQRTNTRVD